MGDYIFPTDLRDLMDNVLPMLERSAVQRQLLAAMLILLLAWLTPKLLETALARLFRFNEAVDRYVPESLQTPVIRLERALRQTYFPLLGIIFSNILIRLFASQGWLFGLLEQAQRFFMLLLAYRILVAVFYVALSEAQAKKYQNRFLRPLFVMVVLIGLNQVLSGVDTFSELTLVTITGKAITSGSLFRAAFVFYLFLAGSWLVSDLLENIVLPRFNLEPGIANTIITFSQYTLVSLGLLATLATLGLDLSTLAIIGAGLSVGIGFGLQGPAADFIGGLLLLFEQSVRPGDVIEINNTYASIEQLSARFTKVRTRDNIEMIIPNRELLASTVTTYTHAERAIRLMIPVGVSYKSEPSEVREALLSAASRHGLVKKRPEPTVFFQDYGASSINFELGIWIDSPELMRQVRSDLRFIIWEELKRRKIEIPFPQHDLHIRSSVPWASIEDGTDIEHDQSTS